MIGGLVVFNWQQSRAYNLPEKMRLPVSNYIAFDILTVAFDLLTLYEFSTFHVATTGAVLGRQSPSSEQQQLPIWPLLISL